MKNNHEKSTDDLLEVLKHNPLDNALDEIEPEQNKCTLSDFLNDLIFRTNAKLPDVMKRSGLTKSYFYALTSGKKCNPSRDVLIQLCFGFQMSLEDSQKFLKTMGAAMLYPRRRRDSIIIHALENRLPLIECNYNLSLYKEKELE